MDANLASTLSISFNLTSEGVFLPNGGWGLNMSTKVNFRKGKGRKDSLKINHNLAMFCVFVFVTICKQRASLEKKISIEAFSVFLSWAGYPFSAFILLLEMGWIFSFAGYVACLTKEICIRPDSRLNQISGWPNTRPDI